MLNPSTYQKSEFITGARAPVDIQVGNDGSFYYLARSTKSVMKVSYSQNLSPVITTQPKSQLLSVGYPVTFSVTASGPTPYSYQWMRNGVNISGATARTYRIAQTTLNDNGARFRVRVTNPYGSVLSNAAVLSVTTNKPPTAQILTPVADTTYFGGMVVNYSGSASDYEDGTLPASAFTWQVDFHHDTHIHPVVPPTTGSKMGTFHNSRSRRDIGQCVLYFNSQGRGLDWLNPYRRSQYFTTKSEHDFCHQSNRFENYFRWRKSCDTLYSDWSCGN